MSYHNLSATGFLYYQRTITGTTALVQDQVSGTSRRTKQQSISVINTDSVDPLLFKIIFRHLQQSLHGE
ncbi:MAG: hypothetical protein ACFFD4_14330 [Candidatus Odinarchaeota archaeon]